jgi:hypothetical protein
MGEPDDGWASDEVAPADAAAASEAKKKNDATVALSEEDLAAMRVPAAAPPAVPTPLPRPVPRNDASMWGGSVLVADEFEPLVVPRKPLGRWLFLAMFATGLVGAALYFLWWQPAQESAAEAPVEEALAAKPAEPQPSAAPAPAPAPDPAPAAAVDTQPATAPAPEPIAAAAVAPDKPAATPPPVKKTSSSTKKSSKKKTSSKKKSKKKTSKKKSSKKKTSRGG